MIKRTTVMIVLLAIAMMVGIASAADDTVTRDLPASAVAGATITVNLTVDVETGATTYLIDESVPSGWTVTSATGGGDYTSDPGHVKWVVFSGVADTVHSYTVDVPADASGVYIFNGTYLFEGMAAEAIILGDTTVTVGAPPALTTITVSPTTANLTVGDTGDTQLFTATAYDQFGDAMPDIVLTWASTNTAVGTVDPTSATTGADGTATTTFTALAAGTTAVGAINGSVYGTAAVTVTSHVPVILAIQFNSNATETVTAGDDVNVSVTVYDSDGWENIDKVVVNMSAFGAGSAEELSLMANDTTQATFNKSIQVTIATSDAVTANASDIDGHWSGDVTSAPGELIVNTAASSKLAIFGPTSATVEANVTLTIRSQDQYGNNETTATNQVFLTTPPGGAGLVTEGSVTLSAGIATIHVTSDTAETVTVTANCAGEALDSATYDIEFMPVITSIEVTSADASIPADTIGNTTITAQLMAGSEPLLQPGMTVTFDVNTSMATVNPASNVTDADGKAYTTLTANNLVGTVIVYVYGPESKSGSTTVDLVVGTPADTTSSTSPDVTSATVGTATTLTATIMDIQNHPIAGENVTFDVTALDGTVGSSTVTIQTDSEGVANATFTLSTTAGINTINVCTETGDVNQNISITGTPGNATQLNVTTSAASIASGAAATITATLEDQYGNPTTLNATGVTASGSAAVNVTFEPDTTASGTLSPSFDLTTIVGSSAQASVTFTANTTKGITTITGSATGYTSDTTAVRTSAPDSISVAVSPASIRANQSTQNATITVQLLDEFGEAISVPNRSVTFVASVSSHVSISYLNGTVTSTEVTDANGTARVNVTSINTTIEPITITVMPDGLDMATVDVTITGTPANVALSAEPATDVVADGVSVSVITAQLKDDSGYDVAYQGVLVTFGKTGGTLSSTTALTDANGAATVNLTSDTAGTVTVTAYAAYDGLPLVEIEVVFIPSPDVLTVDTIDVTPAGPLTMSVSDTQTFDAECYNDSTTTPLTDITVAWASSDTTVGTIDPASGAPTTFTALANGTTTITATAQGVESNAVEVRVGAKTGDIDGSGDVDFEDALYLARYTIFGAETYPLHDDGDIDGSGDVDFDDALYLARHTIFGADLYPLYP